MKKNQKRVHKRRIRIGLIILPVCMLLILGGITGWYYMRTMKRMVYNSLENEAVRIVSVTDAFLSQIEEVYGETVTQNAVMELLEERKPDMTEYTRLRDTISSLKGPDYISECISGFSYVNLKYEWVLSNRGLYAFDELKNKNDLIEIIDQEQQKGEWVRNFWHNSICEEAVRPRTQVNLSGLFYGILFPRISQPITGMLIVNVQMEEYLKQAKLTDNYSLLVFDDKKGLIYCSESGLTEELMKQDYDVGEQNMNADGKSWETWVSVSEKTGWSYILFCPSIAHGLWAAGIMSVCMVMILGAGVIVLYVYFAQKEIYRPISVLVDQTQNLRKDTGDITDEITYLQQNIFQMYHDKIDMESLLETHKKQLENLFLRRLLEGEMTEHALDQQVKQLGIQLKNCYCVLVLSLEEKRNHVDAVALLLASYLPEDIMKKLFLPPYWDGSDIILLAGAKNSEELASVTEEFLRELNLYMAKSTGGSLLTAISNPYSELSMTVHAYYECIEAMKCSSSLEMEKGNAEKVHAVFYADVAGRQELRIIYNTDLEKKMEEAIGEGDNEKCCVIMDELLRWIAENHIQSYELSMVLYHMLNIILTEVNHNGISVNEVFHDRQHNIYGELYHLFRPEDIRRYFLEKIVGPVISAINETRESNADLVCNKILNLIWQSEGNITLNECADYLGYHPGYVWRIMKSRANMTFSEYLAQYKLSLAKKLLEETEEPVAQIAERLQYSSSQNFIRFFSKAEGITPGRYRTLHKKSNRKTF